MTTMLLTCACVPQSLAERMPTCFNSPDVYKALNQLMIANDESCGMPWPASSRRLRVRWPAHIVNNNSKNPCTQ